MMMARVWVNREHLRLNRERGTRLPALTVKRDERTVEYCDEAQINGPSRLVYDPDSNPAVWIETEAEIITTNRRE